jgi:hypothetical protein
MQQNIYLKNKKSFCIKKFKIMDKKRIYENL